MGIPPQITGEWALIRVFWCTNEINWVLFSHAFRFENQW